MSLNQYFIYCKTANNFLKYYYFVVPVTFKKLLTFNTASMKALTNYANFSESRRCSNAESLLSSRIQKAASVVKQQFPKATRTNTKVFQKPPLLQ